MNTPVDPSAHEGAAASAADERAFWAADPAAPDAAGAQPGAAEADLAGFGDPLSDVVADDPPGFYPDDAETQDGEGAGTTDDEAYVDTSAAKKKKAKLLLGGILGGLLLVIGGGFGLKTYLGNQAAAQRAEQVRLMAAVPAPTPQKPQPAAQPQPAKPQPQPPSAPAQPVEPVPAATPAPAVQPTPAPSPAPASTPDAVTSPAPLQSPALSQALGASGAGASPSSPPLASSVPGEPSLLEKLDTLGQATLRVKSDTEALSKSQLEVAAQLNDHGQRLAAIELLLRQLQGTLEMQQATASRAGGKPAQVASSAPSTSAATTPSSTPSAAAPSKPVVQAAAAKPAAPKPPAKGKEPGKEPGPPPAPPRQGSDGIVRATGQGIAGYSVVATYPSTTQPGMSPQKAWVTNGAQIVELAVGSSFNGAKVTRIEGTTVYTSAGVIPSVR